MIKKYHAITAIITIVIILLGVFGLPFLYSCFFDAETIVNEEEPLSESLGALQHSFMETLRYPLLEETQPLSETEIEYFLADSSNYINAGIYERLFELADFPYNEVCWDLLSSVNDTDLYRVDSESSDGSHSVSAVFKMTLPVMINRRSQTAPDAGDMEDAAAFLEGCTDMQDVFLLNYLEEIDMIYDGCIEYQNQLVHLFITVFEDFETQEISVPTLSECCSYGTWEVYSDDKEAALVCLMGRSSLILYYDAAERDFCGFRFEFNVTNE